MTKRPKLGQRIRANHMVVKLHTRKSSSQYTQVIWQRKERKIRGIYIGYRNVVEGRTEVDLSNDRFTMKLVPEKELEVWLIVTHPKQDPLHVLPEDIEVIDHD